MQAVQNILIKGKPDAGFSATIQTEVDKACSGLFIANSYYSCIALAVFEVSNVQFLKQLFQQLPNEIMFSSYSTNNRLTFTLRITSQQSALAVELENEPSLADSLELIKSICDSVLIDNSNHSISLVFDILSFTNSSSIMRTKLLRTYFDNNVVNKETVK